MKIIVNGTSSGAYEANAGLAFLFHINDLSKNTLSYLVNIYADDTKYIGNQWLPADHFSDRILTAQRGKDRLIFNITN